MDAIKKLDRIAPIIDNRGQDGSRIPRGVELLPAGIKDSIVFFARAWYNPAPSVIQEHQERLVKKYLVWKVRSMLY